MVSIFFKLLALFQRWNYPEQSKKITQYWYKTFLLKGVRFGTWINCISKLSIKMFRKKPKQQRPMLTECFQVLTVSSFLTSRQTNESVVKQPSSDITRFVAGHCPMSGANIQIWRAKQNILNISRIGSTRLWRTDQEF